MTRFQKLAVTTTASTLALIAWGGVVRATGSGDGCPDWPTCFGSWVPRWEYHTLIEYAHRLLGVVSGLLAVALAVVGIVELVRARRGHPSSTPRGAIWMAVALVPLFGVQGALGGAVVNSALDPAVVTLHFGLAMILLGVLVAATTLSFEGDRRAGDRGYARLAALAAVATFALLLVGTYVRAEGAGLAFRDWPLMGGRLVPSFDARGAAEMFAHRVLAKLFEETKKRGLLIGKGGGHGMRAGGAIELQAVSDSAQLDELLTRRFLDTVDAGAPIRPFRER